MASCLRRVFSLAIKPSEPIFGSVWSGSGCLNSPSRLICSLSWRLQSHQDTPRNQQEAMISETEEKLQKESEKGCDDIAGNKGEDGVRLHKKIDEVDGPKGPEPTRYGDWERKGRCYDF